MTAAFVDLDVRPILRAGGEPFQEIMQTVAALAPGQGLRLFATFKPVPLFGVLGSKGFSHEAKELEGGDWEVLFRRTQAASESESASNAHRGRVELAGSGAAPRQPRARSPRTDGAHPGCDRGHERG
jgi:uncharacterized protein (DUF2249 family)